MKPGNQFLFLPLGGLGEIGMNLALYGYDKAWVMVDCGVTFGDDTTPGIEILVPDPTFAVENSSNLVGIVLTHAHEDHLGAIPYLWRRLRCPVYATPFAAKFLRQKLSETGLEKEVPIKIVDPGSCFSLGPFEMEFIPVTHSIPETQALAITSKVGTVLHASDWKLDPSPLVGPLTDMSGLRRVGKKKLIALMCDSTNIFVESKERSEGALRKSLSKIIEGCKNQVAVTCFASNVARLETCFHAAEVTGRRVALIGRSMHRIYNTAKDCGYLKKWPQIISENEIGYLPKSETLMVVTGSQGEVRAALARIASEGHPKVVMERGDTVIFSSREIPGNERAIGRLKNQLAKLGISVISDKDAFVHVSGHPTREEIKEFYGWVNPPLLIPIHGETRHLIEHCKFAEECGIPSTALVENGQIIKLNSRGVERIGEVVTGRYAIDGRRLIDLKGEVIRERRRMTYSGVAVATVVLDNLGNLAANPQLSTPGIVDSQVLDKEIHSAAISEMIAAVKKLDQNSLLDDEKVSIAANNAVRRIIREFVGRRPKIEIHIVRL
ncbi:MAG: ribonuclease J [Pseudomonadota bacterium]|nr:ribonuclease J [Pseudomonadota bacterium]